VCSFEDEPEEDVTEMILFESIVTKLLDTPNHLHRACVLCHATADAVGLVRSELMVLIGMMVTRLRRKEEGLINDNTFSVDLRPCYLSYRLTPSSLRS
jgi:hypothetical protein